MSLNNSGIKQDGAPAPMPRKSRQKPSVLSMLLFTEPRSRVLDYIHYFCITFEIWLFFVSSRDT